MKNKICPECGKLIKLWEGSSEKLPLLLHRKWAHSAWRGKALVVLAWNILGLSGTVRILGWGGSLSRNATQLALG